MIKTFETKEEAKDRFDELRNSLPGFGYDRENHTFHREMWNNGDCFTASFTLCGNEIRMFVRDCRISSTATLEKIREIFDEVAK